MARAMRKKSSVAPARRKSGNKTVPRPTKVDTPGPVVLVTGDVVVDHYIYLPEHPPVWPATATREHIEFGGAAIIERLLTREDGEKADVPFQVTLGLVKDAALYSHCYASWAPCASARHGEKPTWRVTGELGYAEPPAPMPADQRGPVPSVKPGRAKPGARPASLIAASSPSHPDILVIDDSGRGFRDTPGMWPACLGSPGTAPHWVIWKISGGLDGGALWSHVNSNRAARGRLIVLVSAADLRRTGHPISRGLSWERTALDTARALKAFTHGPLASARHAVVSFQGAGALWVDRSGARQQSTLVFDPRRAEGDPDEEALGKVYGFQVCFVAGIAWELARAAARKTSSEAAAIRDAVRRGLNARRELQHFGHGPADASRPPRGFPARQIREKAFHDPPQSFATVDMPDHVDDEKWSILSESSRVSGGRGPLYSEARLVALNGLSALAGMPSLEVGAFATVDRQEIESLRRIHDLIRNYESTSPQRQPLSLAVFGAPGAGKSFIVEEIAQWVLGKNPPFLSVNLSQFYDERELIGAFHRVRDLVLKGRTPLIFWDEFDAQEYRWLRLLLAPMQDGTFQEGQIVHPIGKCVFVFAGGTSSSFESFRSHSAGKDAETARDARVWKFAKGPDFVSRIHGSIDVLGPNPRRIEGRSGRLRLDPDDVCFPIRRALFIRGKLGAVGSERLDIEPALLDALLRVPAYTHGSRSFTRILLRLKADGPRFHRRSLLPLDDLASDLDGMCAHPGSDGGKP